MRFLAWIAMFALAVSCASTTQQTKKQKPKKVVIGYVMGMEHGTLPKVNAKQLTHINYAFANIRDGRVVLDFETDSSNIAALVALKSDNPELKILVSVGGWTWSGGFSDMALSTASRAKFIVSCVELAKKHNLDGIDLDWEYPALKGYNNIHRKEDTQNFTLLLRELRRALDAFNSDLLLTIAAGAMPTYVASTELPEISKELDFINLMTYDFAGGWDKVTGHHSQLYTGHPTKQALSTSSAVESFLEAGVPKEKLVVGLAFYGRGWKVKSLNNNGLFQEGEPTKLSLSYYNIRKQILQSGFERFWDEKAQAPYLVNRADSIFVSYEDTVSVAKTCDYILKKGLAGAMFWQYTEDYQGELLGTINKKLK